MARTINETERAARCTAILDAARRLIETKGYQQMTVQDILDELGISKGAFYYYFDSKQAVLEALVERLRAEMEQIFIPIVDDPDQAALDKLQSFFAALAHWKSGQKTFLLALLRIWYADDNAIVRHKVRTTVHQRLTPLLTTIVRQGAREGTLATSYPDQVGAVVLSLLQDMNDALAGLLLSSASNHHAAPEAQRTIAVYTDALERLLGLPGGSLQIAAPQTVREWLDPQLRGDGGQQDEGLPAPHR